MRRLGWAVLVCGCATTYVPKTSGDIRGTMPPGWAPRQPVVLVNAQPSTDDEAIGKTGSFEPVVTSLHDWTEVVIGYARGLVPNANQASRQLGFRVVAAHMTSGEYAGLVPIVRPTCEVELEVSTGSGYRARFRAAGKKFYSWDDACEDATREVAAQPFQDFQILRYLNE